MFLRVVFEYTPGAGLGAFNIIVHTHVQQTRCNFNLI